MAAKVTFVHREDESWIVGTAMLSSTNLSNQQGMEEKVRAYIKIREPSIFVLLFQSSRSTLLVFFFEWFKGHKHYFGFKIKKIG